MKISLPIIYLIVFTATIYYKFFLLGKIPMPADLLVASYSPWFDYYKIPVQNPLISDVFSQFFLWKYLSVEIFKSLEWPLWNPYSFLGTPLLATYHSATLYPLNILLLLPKYWGWGLYIYFQSLIAALTFYLFISKYVKSKLIALIGATIFSWGGLMTTWTQMGTATHAMAWLPLCLYSVDKFIAFLKLRYLLLLIISLSFIILAGNAQITTYAFIITPLYFIYHSLSKKFFGTKIVLLVISLILTLSLTAMQLVPSFDLLQKSIRLAENYTAGLNFGLLNLEDGVKFFIADFFGNPVTRNYWGNLNYSESSNFVGILTLPLLIYGLIYLRDRVSVFFLLLFLGSLLMVFDNFFSKIIYSIKAPLLTSSYASRMLFVTSFSISVVASLALNHLLRNKNLKSFLKITTRSWAALIGIILGTLMSYLLIGKTEAAYLQVAVRNSLFPLIILTTFLFILIFFHQKMKIILAVFLILITVEMGRYFLKFNPFVDQQLIFPQVPAINFLQKQAGLFRVGREHAEILPPNTWTHYYLSSYEGYDPIYLKQYGKFINFINGNDLRVSTFSRYAEITENFTSDYLSAANTKFFMALVRKDSEKSSPTINSLLLDGYKKVFEDKSATILENSRALERSYLAKSVLIASEKQIEDILMENKQFNPLKTAVLSKDLKVDSISGEGIVKLKYYSTNQVIIETETNSEEVLVLADQFEEGWKAMVDQQPVEISPANLVFRAIKIPAGKHQVTFYYAPKPFELGTKISLASFAVILLTSIISIKKKLF